MSTVSNVGTLTRRFPTDRGASNVLGRPEVYAIVAGVGAIAAAVAILAVSRNTMTFGTETDFLGGFLPEAERILAGERLVISFHPPLYSAILAAANGIISDWFTSARMVSWLSVVAVLLSQAYVLLKLFGRYAAFGGLVGLGTSSLFLAYGAMATSDLIFFAFYSIELAVMLRAIDSRERGWWLIAGLVAGLTLLIRTNGIVLIIIGAFPLLMGIRVQDRLRLAGMFALGVLVPLFAWFLVSRGTGSPFWPDQNYLNIAMTYFDEGGNGVSGESRLRMAEQFSSLREVLLHDPPRMMKAYVNDGFATFRHTFSPQVLLPFPFSIVALFGLVLLILRSRSYAGAALIALTVAHMLLINLKTFEPRYYLFLIPLYGAGLGLLLDFTVQRLNKRGSILLLAGIGLVIGLAAIGSFAQAWATVHSDDHELRSVITTAEGVLDETSIVVSRKPHLPHYSGARGAHFPNVNSRDELKVYLKRLAGQQSVFLYYGSQERRRRPQFSNLLNPSSSSPPTWLTPVARGEIGTEVWTVRNFIRIVAGRKAGWRNRGEWVLFRFQPGLASEAAGDGPLDPSPRR